MCLFVGRAFSYVHICVHEEGDSHSTLRWLKQKGLSSSNGILGNPRIEKVGSSLLPVKHDTVMAICYKKKAIRIHKITSYYDETLKYEHNKV